MTAYSVDKELKIIFNVSWFLAQIRLFDMSQHVISVVRQFLIINLHSVVCGGGGGAHAINALGKGRTISP